MLEPKAQCLLNMPQLKLEMPAALSGVGTPELGWNVPVSQGCPQARS